MFLLEDSRRKPALIIVGQNRYAPLNHDRTMIELEIDQVDRTARYLDTVFPCLSLAVQARK